MNRFLQRSGPRRRKRLLGLCLESLETRCLFAVSPVPDVHPYFGPDAVDLSRPNFDPVVIEDGEHGLLIQQRPGLRYYLDSPVSDEEIAAWAAYEAVHAETTTDGDGSASSGGVIAAASGVIPALHSNPESSLTIFLDFDGQVVTGTDWNAQNKGRAIHAAAYDTDGDPTTFSSAELRAIERIWERVSEDYAPFDIDVTTEEPPLADFQAGRTAIRAIITTNYDDAASGGTGDKWFDDSGGVGYIGSWTYRSDTPVWIFENNLSNGTEKFVAEAAAHEVGHSLGLSHDGLKSVTEYYGGHGTGETSWAPIMGAGYDSNVTQWSKGEYNGATETEDDLAIIASTRNGVRYRLDDHGNVVEDSTPLNVEGTNELFGEGIISVRADADFFSFTTEEGRVDIAIDPLSRGPNLDILAELYDADGNLIETFDPENSLDLTIRRDLPAGDYFLAVDGTGNGDRRTDGYSDYASLGQYTISGTVVRQQVIVANSGGAYLIDEGSSLRLDGSDSAGIEPLTFAWDLDGDGEFDDAAEMAIEFSWSELAAFGISDDGAYPIALRVTNAEGTSADSLTTLLVENVSPAVDSFAFPATGTVGMAELFSIQISDMAGAADPLQVAWDLGDGTTYGAGVLFDWVSHTYQQPGSYTVRATITDDDQGTTVFSRTIQILPFVPAISQVVRNDGLETYDTLRSLAFTFTADVSATLQPDQLNLFNQTLNRFVRVDTAIVFWDPETLTATWNLDQVDIGLGTVSAVLSTLTIHDAEGNALDGDGDSVAGGNWRGDYQITVPGDSDLDFDVDFQDFVTLANHFGGAGSWSSGDFDGDGEANFSDFVILASFFGKSLADFQ